MDALILSLLSVCIMVQSHSNHSQSQYLFTQCYIIYCTKMSEVKLSAFIYRLFHEDFSSIVQMNTVDDCIGSVRTVFVSKIEEKSS